VTVRVRIAPSPTGEPHVGNVRTAVFNWLFARHTGGQFIVRIEDTDRTRYQPKTVCTILAGLRWLGLEWDEGPSLEELERSGVPDGAQYAVGGPCGPYIQSERLALYRPIAEKLIAAGWAYRCNCTPERLADLRTAQRASKDSFMYDRRCRDLPTRAISPDEPHVVRLRVPLDGQTVVPDRIKGDMVYDNATIDDQVLLKSDGFPTYHLAVVVDDYHMDITHVIRGDAWISSTPKHLLLYQALGWPAPLYYHVPLVLGSDGKPLAKRHGATSISQFRQQGYLPEALFNFLAFLGWAPGEGEEQEIFDRAELVQRFDLERVNKAPAILSYDKLIWTNGVYIRNLPEKELLEQLVPFWQQAGLVPDPCPPETRATLARIVPLIRERLKLLTDVAEWTDYFFQDIPLPPAESLIEKKMTAAQSLDVLVRTQRVLAPLPDWSEEPLERVLRGLIEEMGLKAGQVFGTIRTATTGKLATPPLFGILSILGREKVLARLEAAEGVLRRE